MTRVRPPLIVAVIALVLVAVVIAAAFSLSGPRSGAPAVASALGAPLLIEQAAEAGLGHTYDGEFEFYVGGGIAAFDCNDDQLQDIYLAGGSGPAALFVNRSEHGALLRFDRRADATTDQPAVTGAYPLDVDSDGITDLAVLRRGENLLLRGLGACQFERANETWSFDGANEWSTAFSAKWDIGALWPTVAVGNYLDEASEDTDRLCHDNHLFTPGSAPGAFHSPITLTPGWCTLSMLFSDWDRSGRRDLRISNDRHYYRDTGDGQEELWRVEAGAGPRRYDAADGWQRLRVFGMGIAGHDLTGDGYPDYYLTSQADNKLQTLAGGPHEPRYTDIALRRGAIAHRPFAGDTHLPSTAWHAEFDDMNNDGLTDLFVSKGNVEDQLDHAARDPSNLLLGQLDGTFVEGAVTAGLLDYGKARGAALVDLNRDGLLDLIVVDRRENVRLYRNAGSGTADAPRAMGNWLQVSLAQAGANRDAIGSWLEVRAADRTTLKEVTVGGGHVSGQIGAHHFGLGVAQAAEVRVTWPDGEVGPWQQVGANQLVLVSRGAASVETIP